MPEISNDDFRPYFRVLRKTGFMGAASIEGEWEPGQIAPAFKETAKQAAEA